MTEMADFARVAVVGLGYVGLPLAVRLAGSYDVVGFDVSVPRVSELKDGHDRTGEVAPDDLATSSLTVTTDTADIADCDLYIITVPTPVDAAKAPDLSPLKSACGTIGGLLSKGDVVVFESTVYPGVTEDFCGPELEAQAGLVCGEDFFLGYSPERINPGDKLHTIDRIIKVVAGQTPEVASRLARVYKTVSPAGIFEARDIRTAEAAKVIENAQRDINIAFMNEVTQIFSKMDLSIHDVLAAANTKWNFLPFVPGLVGGHCIGVDPYYLAHASRLIGHEPEIILAGRRINDGMGQFVADWLAAELVTRAEADPDGGLTSRKVLILGLTFKEDVPDLRNTGAIHVVNRLHELGYQTDIHDPIADPAEAKAEYGIDLLPELPDTAEYGAAALLVGHRAYRDMGLARLSALVEAGGVFADPKGVWPEDDAAADSRMIWL